MIARFPHYFGLLAVLLSGQIASAQDPGGVPVKAWYRADLPGTLFSDAGVTPAGNNTSVYQWNEATGTSFNLLQAAAGSRPVFSNASTLANFNPTVTYDGSNDWMQFSPAAGIDVIDRANGTLYAAGYVNVQKRSGFVGFDASMDYPGLHAYSGTNNLLFFTGGPGYQGQSTAPMAAQSYFTAGTGWQNGAGTNTNYAAATVALNGTSVSYSASQLNNVNLTTSARDLRVGADNNYGAFSGQLNEILVFEDRLNAAQQAQVESYLAIKFGTTYAAGLQDYKNAAGATVWSATTNALYNKNIAGLANDGALQQKQSWSTNAGPQVLISTIGLANTNAANATGLNAGQYLVWGDNGLAKVPTVAFNAVAGLSHRFAAIWKVQNTGAVGTVRVAWPQGLTNLTLIQSNDPGFATGNTATGMTANVITVNGVVYNYADVTLANGQYFTFASKVAAPGGVTSDLKVWLRSDAGFAPSEWQDLSGNLNHYTQTNSGRQPFLAAQFFNFNPVVDFGTTGSDARFMAIPSGKPYSANGTNSTMFTAVLSKSAGGYSDIIGFGATTTTSSLIQANLPTYTKLGSNIVLYPYTATPSLPALAINKLYLNDVSFTVGISGIKYGQDGQTATVAQTPAAGNILHANGSILGAQAEARNGFIGEVIAYERDLTEAEKQRVRSYVAIKYGITLPHNYMASDGTTAYWNVATNAGYNNNIAGLANDESSALNQKQSRSNGTGLQVLIGTTGLANTNALNGNSLTNGQYLVWGDNGQSKSLSVPYTGVAGLNLRFGAIWKVQNTGSAGTVRVAWPAGIVAITLVQSPDSVFDATDTRTDMTANTQTINGVAYNYADVTLSDGQYFTFAGYIAGPGGVGTDLSLWYRADNGVETDADKKVTGWNNSTVNDVKLTMNGATAYIPYNDQTTYTKTWNFNPTLSFDGTNNFLRNTTTTYLNAAGSVHYIAVARLNGGASSYNSIFAISGNDDGFFLYPQNGQVYPMPAIGNGFNVQNAGPGSVNRFGIYSAILPKTGTPANQRGFYNGFEKIYTTPYPITGSGYTLPTTGAFIGADGNTADNPDGDIAEVVLYHNPTGGDMSNADLARIHSYLALKYGITLDQTAPQNYVNSSSSVVWDAVTANAGYNANIAGIGRDDEGSLNQKQSKSVNPGQQVLISTTGLESTNANNTSVLANNQFLIWGDNGLPKAPAENLSGVNGINKRFASVWKVQNTGLVGTVRVAWPKGLANLKIVQSSDAAIDATDSYTDMNGTQMVNGVEYAYADVTLGNGQYFTFAAFVQAPGGVSNGLSHWYRADKLISSVGDGMDVTQWTDFATGVEVQQIGTSALPKYKTGDSAYFNFNPGVSFTATNQKIGNITAPTVSVTDFEMFTLTKEGMSGSRFFNIGMNNTTFDGSNWDHPGLYANGSIGRRTNTGSGSILDNPGNINFATNSPSIMYYRFYDVSMSKGLNGALNGTATTHSARGLVTGGHIFGANSGDITNGDDAGFTGHIGELIIYGNGVITAAERNKVDAYLAIKYGVTLSNNNNYTTSQNVIVWDATANSGFYKNVAGIGNDFVSALHQKQSRSQHANTNNQVTMGLGDIATSNAANLSELSDGQFLLWGDNGNTVAMTNTASTYTTFSYGGGTNNSRHMNRIWKVQNTGVGGELKVRFPKASVGTTTLPAGDACGAYAIIFASDSAITSNITVVALDTTEDGLNYEVMHSFPAGASYFTFGKVTPLSNGVVYLPPVTENTNIYNTNCNVGEWVHYMKTSDPTLKMLGLAGYTTTELDNFAVTITPEGTGYDDGVRRTNVMPRIATVTNSNPGTISSGKVKVYYSQAELTASLVPSALTSGWFKYEGDANEALTDIYNDGVFDPAKAVQLTPAATGTEDGVAYVEFHNVSDFSSFLYLSSTEIPGIVLPVTFLNFDAKEQNGKVRLAWTTTDERNNRGFDIQRSANGNQWYNLGFLPSKVEGGNSSGMLAYTYIDAEPLKGKNFYRLQQTDLDGRTAYSPIRLVMLNQGKSTISVYPNPAKDEVLITGLASDGELRVYDHMGRLVLQSRLSKNETAVNISALSAGLYVMHLNDNSGNMHIVKLVKSSD